VKRTTEVMHAELSKAVCELRRRLEWSQAEIGQALSKYGQATHRFTVSRWERGLETPYPEKRAALAKIADSAGHEDLAAIFRAPIVAWRLVGRLRPVQREEK
jgi:hypothetical protein